MSGRPEQGHWLLARLGKRVLRPGGLALTRHLIAAAQPSPDDRIVEFGPGAGATAQLLLRHRPVQYTAVDPNPLVGREFDRLLQGRRNAELVVAGAEQTGLPEGCADLVVGEAMLTMHSPRGKAAIVAEAARLLVPGGRYAIHELAVVPDDAPAAVVERVSRALSREIHVGARPLRVSEWAELLAQAGLTPQWSMVGPMRLLEPGRLLADEGAWRVARFAWNIARDGQARRRVAAMRQVFRDHADHLSAVGIVAVKDRLPTP